jgi:hypothetical protein
MSFSVSLQLFLFTGMSSHKDVGISLVTIVWAEYMAAVLYVLGDYSVLVVN